MDLAEDPGPASHIPARIHRRDRSARRCDRVHQHPPDSVPSIRLASPRSRGRGRVPRLGREEVRRPALGPVACETPTRILARLRARGLRAPDGILPALWRWPFFGMVPIVTVLEGAAVLLGAMLLVRRTS